MDKALLDDIFESSYKIKFIQLSRNYSIMHIATSSKGPVYGNDANAILTDTDGRGWEVWGWVANG